MPQGREDPAVPPVPSAEHADLCAVSRAGDGVTIRFGSRQASPALPGAVAALAGNQVSLGAAGAARLQDLLTSLLQEAAGRAGEPR